MKNQSAYFRFLVCAAILLSGCTPKTDQHQDDLEAINKLYDTYIHAAEMHDLETFMSCWQEDGIRAEPGLPTIIGKENIRARFEEILSAPVEFKFTQLGEPLFEICNDIAYSYRTITLTSSPHDNSPPIRQDMKVLTIMKRQSDGSWKAYIDCINFHPSWSMDTIPEALTEDNPYY